MDKALIRCSYPNDRFTVNLNSFGNAPDALHQAPLVPVVASASKLLAGLREGKFDVVVTAATVSEDLYRIDQLRTRKNWLAEPAAAIVAV